MNTDDLIARLSQDTPKVASGAMPRRLVPALALGGLAAFLLLVLWLGLRPDLAAALATPPFWIKLLFTSFVAAAGGAMALRLGRPGGRIGWLWLALTTPLAAVLLAAVVQMVLTAPADQLHLWLGQSWKQCPVRIVILSMPVLIVTLLAMRRFAPTRPALAGLAAGLAAGGLAASVYGLYCQETSMSFLATWYVLGMAATGGVGALAGSRLLRW